MTFINQTAGSGASNGYMILETNPSTSSGHRVFWGMIHNSYKSSYFNTINTNDWLETYKSSTFDAVYEDSSKGWYLKPDRKILVEFQFYPQYFDSFSISGKYAKFRFGLKNSDLSSHTSYLHTKSSSLLVPTYYMENNAVFAETSNTSSTYKAIVSHSESSSKPIGFYMDSDSDQNFNGTSSTAIKDVASKIKITQLD